MDESRPGIGPEDKLEAEVDYWNDLPEDFRAFLLESAAPLSNEATVSAEMPAKPPADTPEADNLADLQAQLDAVLAQSKQDDLVDLQAQLDAVSAQDEPEKPISATPQPAQEPEIPAVQPSAMPEWEASDPVIAETVRQFETILDSEDTNESKWEALVQLTSERFAEFLTLVSGKIFNIAEKWRRNPQGEEVAVLIRSIHEIDDTFKTWDSLLQLAGTDRDEAEKQMRSDSYTIDGILKPFYSDKAEPFKTILTKINNIKVGLLFPKFANMLEQFGYALIRNGAGAPLQPGFAAASNIEPLPTQNNEWDGRIADIVSWGVRRKDRSTAVFPSTYRLYKYIPLVPEPEPTAEPAGRVESPPPTEPERAQPERTEEYVQTTAFEGGGTERRLIYKKTADGGYVIPEFRDDGTILLVKLNVSPEPYRINEVSSDESRETPFILGLEPVNTEEQTLGPSSRIKLKISEDKDDPNPDEYELTLLDCTNIFSNEYNSEHHPV